MKRVMLGKSGLIVGQIGLGTGSRDGIVQRNEGKENFIKMIRYGVEHGMTLIDTAPIYHTFWWIKDAIAGIPRDQICLQCKLSGAVIHESMDNIIGHFLSVLGVDYLDSVLLHCMTESDWPRTFARQIECLQSLKESTVILALGFSSHNLQALRCGIGLDWVDLIMERYNPFGMDMDGETGMGVPANTGLVYPLLKTMKQIRDSVHCGCLAMKTFGNGVMNYSQRRKSLQSTLQSDIFNAAVLGFKNTDEIDEALAYESH